MWVTCVQLSHILLSNMSATVISCITGIQNKLVTKKNNRNNHGHGGFRLLQRGTQHAVEQ